MFLVGDRAKGLADSEKDENSRIFAKDQEKSAEQNSAVTGLPTDSHEVEDKFVSTIKFANKILQGKSEDA
jgi:hypothetical protein